MLHAITAEGVALLRSTMRRWFPLRARHRKLVTLGICAAVFAALAFIVLRERPVDPGLLDYLIAQPQPDGSTLLIGAWDAGSPYVASRAEHEATPGGVRVFLYCRVLRNGQGDMTRLFSVRIPPPVGGAAGDGIATAPVIFCRGPTGDVPVMVEPAPPAGTDPLAGLRAQLESQAR